MGHALQGRQRQVQATVGAGPEGAEAVTVQVGVALCRWCQGSGLRPAWPSTTSPGPSPGDPPPGAGGPHTETASLDLEWGGSLKPRLQGRKARVRGGVHAHSEAVVGEEVRDCVAPFSRVGGQGRAAEEAGEAGGHRDGLGSHIEVLGFQPCEPPEPVGNLTKEREADSASHAQSTQVQPRLKPSPGPLAHTGQLLKLITTWYRTLRTSVLSKACAMPHPHLNCLPRAPQLPTSTSRVWPFPLLPLDTLAHPLPLVRWVPPLLQEITLDCTLLPSPCHV